MEQACALVMEGTTWPAMASFSMRAWARLLISSLVHAKCVNSSTCKQEFRQTPCMSSDVVLARGRC